MRKYLLVGVLAVIVTATGAKADVDVIWGNGKRGRIPTKEINQYRVAITPPEYPLEARRQRLTGSGMFELRLDKSGKVKSIAIVKSTGTQMLDQAAMRGLVGFRYKPGVFQKVYEPVVFTTTR